jgi:hypothetical protein
MREELEGTYSDFVSEVPKLWEETLQEHSLELETQLE